MSEREANNKKNCIEDPGKEIDELKHKFTTSSPDKGPMPEILSQIHELETQKC